MLLTSACAATDSNEAAKAINALLVNLQRGQTSSGGTCSSSGDAASTTLNCTFDSSEAFDCGLGNNYTFSSGTFSATATPPEPDYYYVDINANFTVSGGSLSSSLNVVCQFRSEHSFQTSDLNFASPGVIDDCTSERFASCTIGGETIACADFTTAYENSTCSNPYE